MFNFDKRIIYIVLACMVLVSIVNFSSASLLSLLLTLPGVIIAITFHEFAHAWAADRLGDDTPRRQGRLNLNPLSHLDPIGTILLIFASFGWGKPVQINPRNFDKKVSMGAGEAIVSIAGPVMNFILAIVFSIGLAATVKFVDSAFLLGTTGQVIITLLQATVIVNIGLGVFNLLPIPPLDGSKIFINFMPYNVRQWMMKYEHIFYFGFIIIWITGLAAIIISPIIQVIYNGIIWFVSLLFGMG